MYERARLRDKRTKVYVGSFASRRDAELAAQQDRRIKAVELPVTVNQKRTRLVARHDQGPSLARGRTRFYVRPTLSVPP